MRKSRFTDGAWFCKKCWDKEAPADRACASCEKGVDAVLSWHKSKRIEGAPWLCMSCYLHEVRASRFFPPFHANANARRSPPRFSFGSQRAVRVFRFPTARENLDRDGDDVRRVLVEQDRRLVQLPGRARGQGLHEVLQRQSAPGQPHEQKAEEVNVRVLYFLSPRFPRSRRSFDDAPFSPDAALPMRNAFDAIVTIDTIAGSE
jgi:hypothetical protein